MPLWGIQVSVDGQMLSFFGFGSVRYPLPLDDPHRKPVSAVGGNDLWHQRQRPGPGHRRRITSVANQRLQIAR